MDQLSTAAAAVARKRRELEERLAAMSTAHPLRKMEHAPLIVATFYELLDHQTNFNECAIAGITEALHRSELLAAKAGCSFASVPASSVAP